MVQVPLFPTYRVVQACLRAFDGMPVSEIKDTWNEIWALRGTPQAQVAWSDPDTWIPARLHGKAAEVALQIWNGTGKLVNPRYLRGPRYFIDKYGLMEEDSAGHFVATEAGRTFLEPGQNAEFKRIDKEEGLLFILQVVSRFSGARRADFQDEWRTYLLENSNYRQDSVVKDSLYRRLINLIDRGLIVRKARTYEITSEGLSYLSQTETTTAGLGKLTRLVKDLRLKSRKVLRAALKEMPPYRFEVLVKSLLEAMGYENVEVTAQSNDRGVDVVGAIEMGITRVREVVQVKRLSSNVGRRVLDELRGSLHRFGAVQGTIITLSDFSRQAKDAARERGAAPITLINGERLIDLLVENGLGIKKERIEYFVVDELYFASDYDEEHE